MSASENMINNLKVSQANFSWLDHSLSPSIDPLAPPPSLQMLSARAAATIDETYLATPEHHQGAARPILAPCR